MNKHHKNTGYPVIYKYIALCIIIASVAYAVHYFNYMATPTEDFISNFRQKVLDIHAGKYPGASYNIMPVFPIVLAFLTKINPFHFTHDSIYDTAILLNILLFIPYMFLVYDIFRRFLEPRLSLAALLLLSVNINTAYTAVNAELEMLMTLLIVFAIWLSVRDSKFAYIPAFFASGIKYDSVFIIPAVMFRDFFLKRQRIITLVLGALSSAGVCLWLFLSVKYGNSYVSEIASRGPNIYMFPIDCILTAAGFVPWTAMHGYESSEHYFKIPLYAVSAIFTLFVLVILVRGVIFLFRQKRKEAVSILVFFSGFVLIHMIYQNTKTRYVLPILCFMYLFMFYGLPGVSSLLRRLPVVKISAETSRMITRIFAFIAGAAFIAGTVVILFNLPATLVIFSFVFTALLSIIIFADGNKERKRNKIMLALCGCVIINLSLFYGVRTMDHYSYRRVEFKEAALWYSAHSANSDRMLISITDMPMYYTGLPAKRFIGATQLRSTTLDDLIKELHDEKVTHVFVDDFYIRRYRIKDPNSIEKKAWLFKDIRDKGEATKRFKQVAAFEPRAGIKSYMYRFIP
ncbi:MAG: hypothetical protein V1874_11365 [Spirochaetota bacterium]